MRIVEVSPREASAKTQEGWRLIDVRTAGEFGAAHAEGALNLPLDQLTPSELRGLCGDANKLLMICQSGGRSKKACEKLMETEGFEVLSVAGGTREWEVQGFPVIRGAGVISIERQVRIAAGTFVLGGSCLGLLVDKAYFVIPLFVGAGLIFAGITDFCGMGMLLARMPWNRRPSTSCSKVNNEE